MLQKEQKTLDSMPDLWVSPHSCRFSFEMVVYVVF